jgi:hypothetical protein
VQFGVNLLAQMHHTLRHRFDVDSRGPHHRAGATADLVAKLAVLPLLP